ncbi:DUF485 domain-containing protein [Psychrobacter sp.]|uniref:DUF485 domain-containing protein n=1 Tax=Psychrobacter sp. TaxID=56811 RepID=UPI0025F4A316|nr:DUF485 domain-containing protein [Psychrobacter sp.]
MMDDSQVQRILQYPEFQNMARKKASISRTFSIITFVIYFGYMLLIGFDKSLLGTPISAGMTTTIGVYAGFFVIIFAVVITGIYVRIANGKFDTMTHKVVDDIVSGRV